MKNFFKFFGLIFLLFTTTVSVNCLEYNDFRSVRNPKVIELIKTRVIPSKEAIGLEKDWNIFYGSTIFILNAENVSEVTISTPVLNSNMSTMIGEIVTTVEIQETEKIDINNVLNYFTSNSDSFRLSYSQLKFLRVPSGDQNKNLRHIDTSYFASFLKGITIAASDRIYFMTANNNIEDISIIHETCEGVKTIFNFQPPFGIVKLTAKPAEPTIPPSHKKPWSWLFGRIHKNWCTGGYIRLQAQDKKQKID